MKIKSSSGKRVAKRRFFKADERFATKAVIVMMKRLAEVIVGRIKKKEKIDITESEDTNNDY